MRTLVLLLTLLFYSYACYAENRDSSIIVSVDVVDAEGESDINQQVNYKFPFSTEANVYVSRFQYRKNDSICLYNLVFNEVRFRQGFHSLDLNLRKADTNFFLNKSFFKLLAQFGMTPPGLYKTYITINCKDTSRTIEVNQLSTVDSTLAIKTRLRSRINKALAKADLSKQALFVSDNKRAVNKAVTEAQVDMAKVKIDRSLRKMHGVTTRPEMRNGKAYVAVYYEDWFLGKYEVITTGALNEKIAAEYNAVKNKASSLVSTDLEDFTSISSQIKELYTSKEDKYLTGVIDVSSVFGNGQEPGSEEDNNYLELRGDFQAELLNIPVAVEAYYTTEDRNRQAKASYVRFHYDVQQSKDKLEKMISSYKNKYSETVSKGDGLESVYSEYVNKLNAQQLQLNKDFSNYGIDPAQLNGSNTDQLFDEAAGRIDTSELSGHDSLKNTALKDYQKTLNKRNSIRRELKSKYERLTETQQKINKYTALIRQYKDQLTLDSGLVYSKLEKLQHADEASYKDMAKAASGLLPEGKTKKFIYGITHLDVGIINQYESDYTASGQTLKGGSVGYDFGFVKTGLTIGKTEYISRDGTVDQYSSTMLRGDFKPFLKQQFGFIYYTYSPSKKLLQDDFFKDDVSMPSFQKPVHIVSVTHEGTISKNLSLQNELAASYKEAGNGNNILSFNSSAIKTAFEYAIPKTSVNLKGEWEHVGKDFENSSLPYINAATERYTVATTGDFFKSFLSVGIQYNYLKQETFSSTGYSTKWGFDVRTHSKRYPSFYVSYKPFSTFRAFNDTFTIQQRPLVGEVWVAKGTYQIKRKSVSHRFMLIYNQNSTSTADTQNYRSKTLQLGYIYLSKGNSFNINLGWMQLPVMSMNGGPFEGNLSANSYFINAAINRRLGQRFSLMLGQDLATAHYGLQRWATTTGIIYSLKRVPLALRLQGRYSSIKFNEQAERINLWQGQAGINWRFRTKVFSKKTTSKGQQ
ncbi:MAG TPA: hypothetical protein VL093_00945 [Flavipsychrobacter sp.]|jgi:hypothetical protein|nr:hypothetical protein [Flavipsychrobacter sp.]